MAVLVRRAGSTDEDDVVAILTEAFADNAPLAWVFGTAEAYRRLAPAYFRWVTQRALADGGVYLVDGKGAMLGLPSSALDADPERVQQANQQLRALGAERAEYLLAYEDACRQHHPMHTPHWYGWFGGVRRAHRGHKIGRFLMHHILREHSDLPYYHEATPRNAVLWGKTGFRPIGTFEITEGITLIQMWREPAQPEA